MILLAQTGITLGCAFLFAQKQEYLFFSVADWGHHLLPLYKITAVSERRKNEDEDSIDNRRK